MDRKIYVIAEHAEGKIRTVTYELLAFADHLRTMLHLSVEMLVLGDGISAMTGEIEKAGADCVTLIEIPGLTYYNGEIYRHALQQFFSEQNPAFVCMAHSSQGMDFAPGLAVRLNAANITAVQGIAEENGKLCFVRAIDNGKRIARVRPLTDTVILNIQPGAYRPLKNKEFSPASVSAVSMEYTAENTCFAGLSPSESDTQGITEAKIVVSVGNGIGDGEHLDTIYKFADLFPKSAVGGSRIVCDRGLLPYHQQVGITGATVAPKLYIACGISGSSQHLAGMSGSEFIVAVNTDARAPMMNAADVCIVEDMNLFINDFMDIYMKSEK
ncbi:MAG: electron transfer flavoprotein subunit alpha/FixB family protein [Desulfococcaceae bacterium]